MKTTIDLPEDLLRRLKLRALRDGRKLKEVAADMIRKGLKSSNAEPNEKPAVIGTDRKTGLPILRTRRRPPKNEEMTPGRVADILLAQEIEWARDSA